MAIRNIIQLGDETLRKKSFPVRLAPTQSFANRRSVPKERRKRKWKILKGLL